MRPQRGDIAWQTPEPDFSSFVRRNIPVIVYLVLALLGMSGVYWYFSPGSSEGESNFTASLAGGLTAPIYKSIPAQPVTQRLAQSPGPLRVGIISGHMGNDSGSVCDDGLTEAEVNESIATRVAEELRAKDVRVDLLEEFDPRLDDYSATAVISVHADSCTYVNDLATGYKIAGSSFTDSTSLSICVEQAYGEATQLPYHEHTITPHMTEYHAFRKLALGTPAIIIEVGFMNLDREILTNGRDAPVDGLVAGISCFLEAKQYPLGE